MPLEGIKAPYYFSEKHSRLQQGDILRDLTVSEVVGVTEEGLDIAERKLLYCVVLSQDCDLEHDFGALANPKNEAKDDKVLPALLLCPAYPTELFKQGTHLAERDMRKIPTKELERIASYQVYRYHYLPAWADRQVPELIMDFKHYFTLPRTLLYQEQSLSSYLATIEILYREYLSTRFAHYLSRIGLPDLASE